MNQSLLYTLFHTNLIFWQQKYIQNWIWSSVLTKYFYIFKIWGFTWCASLYADTNAFFNCQNGCAKHLLSCLYYLGCIPLMVLWNEWRELFSQRLVLRGFKESRVDRSILNGLKRFNSFGVLTSLKPWTRYLILASSNARY